MITLSLDELQGASMPTWNKVNKMLLKVELKRRQNYIIYRESGESLLREFKEKGWLDKKKRKLTVEYNRGVRTVFFVDASGEVALRVAI